MPMHSGHPYSMPTCFWDDVATGFFHEWPNQDSATSDSTACAFLEAIAVEAETDISNIECGHSSLREHTMQRGRGHITSLCEVAAKSFAHLLANIIMTIVRVMMNQNNQKNNQQASSSRIKSKGKERWKGVLVAKARRVEEEVHGKHS